MESLRKLSILVLFYLITFSIAGDSAHHQKNVQDKQKDPSPTQMLEEAYSMLATSSFRSWDMVKSYINQLQMKYFPPNVDFRSNDDGKANGERIKEATQKSFEQAKETVEGSAKSAAEVMEQKVHETAEKVKDTMSAGHKTAEKIKDTVSSAHDEL